MANIIEIYLIHSEYTSFSWLNFWTRHHVLGKGVKYLYISLNLRDFPRFRGHLFPWIFEYFIYTPAFSPKNHLTALHLKQKKTTTTMLTNFVGNLKLFFKFCVFCSQVSSSQIHSAKCLIKITVHTMLLIHILVRTIDQIRKCVLLHY